MSTIVPVTFAPAGVTVWVSSGTTVLEASRLAGIVIAAPCGGRGVCGSCGVRVTAGELAQADTEEALSLKRGKPGVRLACRARITGSVTIRPVAYNQIPARYDASGVAVSGKLVAGVDLGTTSIAAALIDANTGLELARSIVPNPQQTYGADVLSRLSAALDGRAEELRDLAGQGVVSALQAAATTAGVSLGDVERLAIAGNTAMTALLLGADVASLAVHPFTPPGMGGGLPSGSLVRAALMRDAEVVMVPPIASFVGGDALAGTLTAGMIEAHAPMLLVDFGTNAEIVLAGAGPLVVASAAAGPAFEGVGVSCGGPAAPGAVTGVRLGHDGSVELEVLGSEPAGWFSGSGLVSAFAELRRHGHLDGSGLLLVDGPLSARFARGAGEVLQVNLGDQASECLVITQLDIRALQLAKAAVRVGIQAVLAAGGVCAGDLESVLIAGAFGSALHAPDLIELGVLPRGVDDRSRPVGNASLGGAAIVALDPTAVDLAVGAAACAVHVDLAADEGFARALVEATELAEYAG